MDIIYDDCSLSNESVGLLMTYRCNLDCSYCYIKNKLNKDMTLETAKAILEPFLMKDDGWLDIIFVGGETLMATDVIRPLVEWAKNGGYKRHCRFFGSTNGTLLNDELKAWLTEYKDHLILSLSYDGIPSVQKNNRGCDDIDTDFFIRTWPGQSIQMTVNSKSVEHMAEGVIYLLEKGAIVHPNVAYEDSDWSDDKISEYAVQLRKLIDYYNSHDDLPMITQFVHNVHEYADNIQNPKAPVQVCGVGNGFQVFDTDGSSYPCHILSPLVLDGEKLEKIKNGILSKAKDISDERCTECPYITSCSTCMACNYLYRGSFAKRDHTHCRIMQTDVQAFIKKEVLRLQNKKELSSDDAALIDSIKMLFNYLKAFNS